MEIIYKLQDTMNAEEHDTLISLLESEEFLAIKRNFWGIKKLENSSNQLEKKIR
jgi:hypothetical protein